MITIGGIVNTFVAARSGSVGELLVDTDAIDQARDLHKRFDDQGHLIRGLRRLSRYTARWYVNNPTRYAGHVSTAD